MAQSDTLSLTIGNLNTLPSGLYQIFINSSNHPNDELSLYLIVKNGVENAPQLEFPLNDDLVSPNIVDFQWQMQPYINSFDFELSTDSNFTNILYSENTLLNTISVPDLNENTDYFWRVSSNNACGQSLPSLTSHFSTLTVNCSNINSIQNDLAIPNGGEPIVLSSILNVNLDLILTDVNVTVNVSHGSTQDLKLSLLSPQGTEVVLTQNFGDDGDNYINTVFDQDAFKFIGNSNPPFSGSFRPVGNLDDFNNENSAGEWIFTLTDFSGQQGGVFDNFSLELCGSSTLSISHFNFKNYLSIWPNPTSSKVFLSFGPPLKENLEIAVLDLAGREIKTFKIFNRELSNPTIEIDLSELSNAIYLIKLEHMGVQTFERIIKH